MTPLVLALVSLPCVYWTEGMESKARLEAASIKRICVAAEQVDNWRAAGFSARPISPAELASREALPAPGVTARAGLASPTRAPWIVANGWRFLRHPAAKYVYDATAGSAALSTAEAFAYGVDAVLKIDAADLQAVGALMTFLEGLPSTDLPTVADFAVVDDGSAVTGEVMNLLVRRNLLFKVVEAPSPEFRINVAVGKPEYPVEEAGDPSAFAQKIRRQLTDEQRSVRVYGSEVVICRLTGDAQRLRLHLLNYGRSEIQGLHIRLRGAYRAGEAYVAGAGRVDVQDHVIANGATEFSIPRLGTYAVIDLQQADRGLPR
jgi:hypothetical protein